MAGVFEIKNANGNKATLLFPDTSLSDVEVDLSSLDRIGLIDYGYVAKSYHIVAFGGEFNRTDYPKLWAYLQVNPSLLKTQAEWTTENTTNGMCGYFSSGNGTTTFRVPNLDKAFLRPDSRTVGSFQADELKSHNHLVETNGYAGDGQGNLALMRVGHPKTNPSTNTGGTETRPRNIAILPLIVAK